MSDMGIMILAFASMGAGMTVMYIWQKYGKK